MHVCLCLLFVLSPRVHALVCVSCIYECILIPSPEPVLNWDAYYLKMPWAKTQLWYICAVNMLIHSEYVDFMVPSVCLFTLLGRQSLALECSVRMGGSLEIVSHLLQGIQIICTLEIKAEPRFFPRFSSAMYRSTRKGNLMILCHLINVCV